MYENYWRLDRNPFDFDPDPQLFYASETHQAALLKLRYLIENRKGVGVLAGASGTGKSFLTQVLVQQLADTQGPFIQVLFPRMSAAELLAYIIAEMGSSATGRGETLGIDRSIREFEALLNRSADQGRHPVLIIDDAHLIDDAEVFQALRLLLNIQPQRRTGFSLILLGQPELLVKLRRLADFESRLAVKSLLRPLTAVESAAYVQSRLAAAGGQQCIFPEATRQTIFELSGGIPRNINRLCDLALLVGYADDASEILPDQIEAISEELDVALAE